MNSQNRNSFTDRMFVAGGETGKIEVKGGAGDVTYGGGGAGGRIAVYHYHDIDAMAGYRGEMNTEGGTGAEPGASGTIASQQAACL